MSLALGPIAKFLTRSLYDTMYAKLQMVLVPGLGDYPTNFNIALILAV